MEIKNYDTAANRFYSTLNINSLPITSWDLFSTSYDTICKKSKDVFQLQNFAKTNRWSYSENFNEALFKNDQVLVVTDTTLKIVHVTQNIINMNGYKPEEILGKKPKMFQGVNTCKKTAKAIGIAVKNKQPFEAVILNYRKDGSSYKCWIKGEPIFNNLGEVVNFIAYEKEVA